MYASSRKNANGGGQPVNRHAEWQSDFLGEDFYVGFEGVESGVAPTHGFMNPAVNAVHQRYSSNETGQEHARGELPPPPPPRSLLYGMAESEMSFTNSQNLQFEMLQKVDTVAKENLQQLNDQADAKNEAANQTKSKPVLERKKTLQRAKTVADLMNKDEKLKSKMKEMYVDELMKRQEKVGTFEITEGTVKAFKTYGYKDPVVMYAVKEKSVDMADRDWDCELDCEFLRKAMKGLGTDEDAIIHVVTTRSNSQRQELKAKYKNMFGRDLIKDLHSELSGDFREAVMACFVKPAMFDAWSVKEAIYGLGTDEQTLIEILMTRTNEQLLEMRKVYSEIVSPNRGPSESFFEADISDDTSGDFKRLLLAVANGRRVMVTREQLEAAVEEGATTGTFQVNYDKLVDVKMCKEAAHALYEAGEARWGTDEETFIKIFSLRSYYELRRIWSEYVKISQCDILNTIDKETSWNFRKGLIAIVKNIKCRPMYFAERLKAAMKGLGTADKDLIRIIVSRSEIDMVQIKRCFYELTQQTLWTWLKDDCSGDYRKLLQGLVGRG